MPQYSRRLDNIANILQKASDLPTAQERVEFLREHDMPAIRSVLKGLVDASVKFLLPDTTPPYTPSTFDEPSRLYSETKRFYLFIDGGHPDLSQRRREELFIDMIETLAPVDADLVLNMVKKHNPYPGLTGAVINKAYPGLIVR